MMKTTTFEELVEATDLETAMDVVAIRTVNTLLRPTPGEWKGEKSFGDRVMAVFAGSSGLGQERVRRAMDLMVACNDYETARDLAFGGPFTGELATYIAEVAREAPAAPTP